MAEDSAPHSPQPSTEVKKLKPKVTVEEASGSDGEGGQPKSTIAQAAQDDKESGEETPSEPVAGSSKDGEIDASQAVAQNEWQAVWAPAYNAYYFYNTRTKETTWTNPLQPPSESANQTSTEGPSTQGVASADSEPSSSRAAPQAPSSSGLLPDEAALNGIDPALAYLDPTLYAARPGGAPPNTFTAKFNARTGRFTAMSDGRDPSYLSEAERAKRMSSVFFDVEKWETDVASRKAQEAEEEASGTGDKRKRPTKADLERWKEAKKRKKQAKHAWLLN
ncbi:hypothetical protein FRB90_003471 [Tulasnella sp. 427]|nr:hypothetical protein FRB90_003471 [Tulasnella sp. 427]